jgi:low affinity Fe/Cu permease
MDNSLLESIPRWMGSKTSIILHTIFFAGIFILTLFGFSVDQVMLILTTAVSLEAIYLSLFIQMTVNEHSESLESVEVDIDEIQKDVEGIEDDVDEIQKDVEGIEDDVEDISKDFDEIQKDEDPIKTPTQVPQNNIDNIYINLRELIAEVKSLRKEVKNLKKHPN